MKNENFWVGYTSNILIWVSFYHWVMPNQKILVPKLGIFFLYFSASRGTVVLRLPLGTGSVLQNLFGERPSFVKMLRNDIFAVNAVETKTIELIDL